MVDELLFSPAGLTNVGLFVLFIAYRYQGLKAQGYMGDSPNYPVRRWFRATPGVKSLLILVVINGPKYIGVMQT